MSAAWGHAKFSPERGELIMPLNEIPKYINPEMRALIDAAVEEAWQEIRGEQPCDENKVRRKLAGTIVALLLVDETDPAKLRALALNAARAMIRQTAKDQA